MSQTKEKKAGSRAVNLLWTGGWDSTYRLLDLLLIKKLPVCTYYVINHTRRCRFIEMETMMKILDTIVKIYPETNPLFRKIVFTSRTNIPEDEEVIKKCKNLEKNKGLGDQYRYLARYAKIHSSDNLEICIQDDDFEEKFDELFSEYMRLNSNNPGFQFWELVDVDPEEDISIFTPFRFPVRSTSKLQMKNLADEHGFLDILEMTWWCHNPIRGKPCGACTPCKHYVEVGMAFRLPRSAVLRYKWTHDPLLREIRYFLQYIHRTLKKVFTHAPTRSNDTKKGS